MQTRGRFLKSVRLCGLIVLVAAAGAISRQASAQAALDRTTLGQSQNDVRDLANSLAPGPKKFGKGEKKQEINPAELKSKSTKDTTFGGSLLNMGIDPAEPKLDESKVRNAQKDSSVSKQPASVIAKESKHSETTAGQERQSSSSTGTAATAGDTQGKKSTSSASDERPSTNSTDKSSASSKPDGGGR